VAILFVRWQYDLYGLPTETSWIPDMRLNYTQELGFFERMYNTFFGLKMYLYHMKSDYYPKLTEIIRNGLQDPNIPDVFDLQRNISVMLVNSYFAAEYARSLPPFVIPVGGLHCSTANQKLSPVRRKFKLTGLPGQSNLFVDFYFIFILIVGVGAFHFKIRFYRICFHFIWDGIQIIRKIRPWLISRDEYEISANWIHF